MKDYRFVAFDVETPNCHNDRMSAIGVVVVEHGEITKRIYTLVDPETHFDWFNVNLTGITPEMVEGKPSFRQLWEFLQPYFDDAILIAHNAPFDMGVLNCCLRAYGIEWKPYAHYACTCKMGRVVYPGLENHKLNTMCAHVGIELDHHNAGSDAEACARLLLDYMDKGLDVSQFIRTKKFDVPCGCA